MSMITKVAHALQTEFAQAAAQANEQTQAVVRKRKFTPVTLAQSFILALLKKPAASGEDVALMAAARGVEVSSQACEQRYSPALCNFFKTLLFKMVQIVVQADEALASLLERFSEVKLIDSSSIQLPDCQAQEFPACGGKGRGGLSVMKLQTELDLRTGQLTCLQPEPGKSPDQGTDRQHVPPREGSLRIADLGDFSIPVLHMIALAKAYFLTRIQHVIKIPVESKKQSLIEWLNSQSSVVVDREIGLGGSYCLACRLIAWRVPEEMANRRRAKLRAQSMDKAGREPSRASLAACDWELLVTNLCDEQLRVKEAIVLYRARWQIEISQSHSGSSDGLSQGFLGGYCAGGGVVETRPLVLWPAASSVHRKRDMRKLSRSPVPPPSAPAGPSSKAEPPRRLTTLWEWLPAENRQRLILRLALCLERQLCPPQGREDNHD